MLSTTHLLAALSLALFANAQGQNNQIPYSCIANTEEFWASNPCSEGFFCRPTIDCMWNALCGGTCHPNTTPKLSSTWKEIIPDAVFTPTSIPSITPPVITPRPTRRGCRADIQVGQCGQGSICSPTETCTPRAFCGGSCVAIYTAAPTPNCHVSYINGGCVSGGTCVPTQYCVDWQPCWGTCSMPAWATPTPTSKSKTASKGGFKSMVTGMPGLGVEKVVLTTLYGVKNGVESPRVTSVSYVHLVTRD